ncbi:MAG: hypothetical protein H6R04_649 [Burkholderiaceae bacterium]|nr:hypothetical protein [Burkholderiaceae bacterium]
MMHNINIYAAPATQAQLESWRRNNSARLFASFAVCIGSFLFFGLMHDRLEPAIWLVPAGIVLFCLFSFVRLMKRARRVDTCGPETPDALICSGIPAVVAYCNKVKQQGRMLTYSEAEAMLAICAADPEALKRVQLSYHAYDEAHPISAMFGFWSH